jgi:hypothetical protein
MRRLLHNGADITLDRRAAPYWSRAAAMAAAGGEEGVSEPSHRRAWIDAWCRRTAVAETGRRVPGAPDTARLCGSVQDLHTGVLVVT